ncbi:polyprenyl synthetase family protein [Arenimonas sp.]|jgi:geranylgeranyl pyrophosphate synthase|uniref:polyprenyl synthetase family protein n=1 Tax=Arenimonas sp. TaxID=1872635 RepID=UPI0037BF9E0B
MPGTLLNFPEASPAKLTLLLEGVDARMQQLTQMHAEYLSGADAAVSAAATYHLRAGGQKVRARLGLSSALALGLSESAAIGIAACAELLHNASLIHDDLQDGDLYRRGVPSVWNQFGKNTALCCGDLFLSAAYAALGGIGSHPALPEALAMVHRRVALTVHGQCADLAEPHAGHGAIEQYLAIAKSKSGALLALPIELSLLLSGNAESIPLATAACENFAVSYQALDDIQDIAVDAARPAETDGAGMPGLNLVLILQNKGLQARALPVAVDLARTHLSQCETDAVSLPCGAGRTLLAYSAGMREKLDDAVSVLEAC